MRKGDYSSRERAWEALRAVFGVDYDPLVATMRMARHLEDWADFSEAGRLYLGLVPYVYQRLAHQEVTGDPNAGMPIVFVDMRGAVVDPRRDPMEDFRHEPLRVIEGGKE